MRPVTGSVLAAASLVVLSVASCAPAYVAPDGSRTYYGFMVGLYDAPPPPALEFGGPPRYEPIEDSDVQWVEAPDPSCDLFLYHGAFYLYQRDGYWYRSRRPDGGYVAIEVHQVPRAVLQVDASHWRHRPDQDEGPRDRGRPRGWRGDDDDDRRGP